MKASKIIHSPLFQFPRVSMSFNPRQICLKYSSILFFLLLFQASFAQQNWQPVDKWMKDNLTELGGRAVMLVWKDGKLVYNHAENKLNGRQIMVRKILARRQGMDADEMLEDFDVLTKQPIASCSKWLSAALVTIFVDEGKLSIDDTIGKFLPVMTEHGKGQITIWECLSHLTGIKAEGLRDNINEMKKVQSMDEAMKLIAEQPMEGEPGKTFHYSNYGLQIAAAVIEKISGKDFETLFQERIAQPLDMKDTDYGSSKVPLAAGGAWSTPLNYMNFLVMILHEGEFNGKRILSKQSVETMQINRVAKDATIAFTPAEAGNWGYGFGEWVMDSPLTSSPIGGGDSAPQRSNALTSPGLFGSFPWVDYENDYAAFLFVSNLKNKGRREMYMDLKDRVDKALN